MAVERAGVVHDPTPNAGSIMGFPFYGAPPGEGEILVFRNGPPAGWYVEPGGGGGGGDMFKAVYDADNDLVVDAANAVRIGGITLVGGAPPDGTALRYDFATNQWVFAYVPSTQEYPGNPNNVVDGRPGDFVIDTVNDLLWWKRTAKGNLAGWHLT